MIKRGTFIVIDGGDGAGKKTQMDSLVAKLQSQGHQVKFADFPQYGQPSAHFVERYLRGEYGGLKDVDAYKASIFYALDRFEASFQIKEWLEHGFIVVSNRYTSANKGHQLGKITIEEEKHSFLKWVNHLEYEIFGIPKPDLTIFLHMDSEIGQQLVDRKGKRDYVEGRDIHEANLSYLRNTESGYFFCLQHDLENWKKVVCFTENKPRSREEIHDDVYLLVNELLNQEN